MRKLPPFATEREEMCGTVKPNTHRRVYCELPYWHEAEGFKSHRTRAGHRWYIKPKPIKIPY